MSTRLICRYLVVSALVVALHRQLIVASDTGGDTGVTLDPGPQFYGQGQPQQCVNGTRTFCQHGGRCVLDHVGRASCDCAGTGYTGRACHFAIYKQSCQELYLSGHRESGNYVIDVDRNGPCPPARVVCHMDKEHIKTTIVHNVPNELVVRSKQMNGFYLNVTYRDFDDDMIKRLISNSRKCYQTVRYECRGVPLGLSSITWFRTTGNTRMFDFGGSALGSCTCSDTQSCSGRKWCNCDNIRPNDWQVDSGNVTDPAHLAIGQLHFLRPSGLRPESEGRFWLGPLECLDIPSEEQAITFKTLDSRLLLDHQWPFGHLAFSFRTVQERSVILHQHCSRNGSSHGHLIIAVMGSNEIEFTYKVDGNTRSTRLMTPGPLNDGQWQVVRVDHDDHHMRFTVNLVDFMIDLPVVGMFDGLAGPLTIGGSGLTDTCLDNGPLSGSAAMPGFRGCFRGLSVDDSRVDMYQHLASRGVTIAEDELETGCKSSCTIDHHPCQNGATCVEQWGSFECLCSNPVAQSGKLCEINLNGNSVTFASARAFLHIMHSPINSSNERTVNYGKLMNLFTGDIQVAFRTQSRRALIFYANDHLNNFVQLIVDQGRQIGFTFNVDNQLSTMLLGLEGDLDDGQLVQLAIERNETTISMTANSKNVISHHHNRLLTNYTQHPWTLSDRHLEQVRPPRPEVGPDDYVQLFVGGVDGLRGKTSVPTLIGCIMGLIVAGQQVDIMKEAETMKSPLLQTGCEQLCKGDTCGHGGHCSDRWSPKGTVCTCEDTSYRGHDCRQDIGAKFDGHSVVRLVLPHLSVPVRNVKVDFAFNSVAKSWQNPVLDRWRLLLLMPMHENYLLVALSSHGSILIEEKSGTNFFRRVVFDEKVNYGDGWRHWIAYRRDGNEAKLIINGEKQITVERTTESAAESKGNLDISSIMLGYNNSTLAAFEQFKSFVGCISNVILQVDSLEIKPLDWAFTGKNLSQITVRQIKRATCSEPRSLTMIKTMSKKRIKSVLATQNVPEWRPEPSTMVTYSPIIEDIPFLSGSTLITLSIAAGCSAFLIVVLTPMAIYMCYLHRRDKLKKFQLETPFFHSKRRRSKAFPTLTEDEYTVARLLKFQHGRVSRLAHIQTITEEDEQFSDITDDGTSTIATLTDL